MQLENVTAEIRPRAPWESIDLGCSLARKHIGVIWKAWAVTVFPLWAVLAVLLQNHPIWLLLCIWWLKPLYDRVPLMVLSRSLFGAEPTVLEVMKAWPKMLVRRLFFALFIGRFSPARSLSLPVAELEGLRGRAYSQRVNLLERNGGEGATMATLSGILLELVTGCGIVMLAMMMVPGHTSAEWSEGVSEFFIHDNISEISLGFFWLAVGVYMFSITVMEPFYVSAGFALYINSRTLTEGWDIELAFKRLSIRIKKMKSGVAGKGTALILLTMLGVGSSQDAYATGAGYRESAQQVLSDDDFTIHYKNVEVPVKKADGADGLPEWLERLLGGGGSAFFMGTLSVIIFWTILAVVVGGLIYLIIKNRHSFSGGIGGSSARVSIPKTEVVMGMDIRPESLPDDVVNAARAAWRDGDSHLALSLLYRGSITWFVHRGALPIAESDTEGDCLRRVQEVSESEYAPYFSSLTKVWVNTAYGENEPEDSRVVELCDTWPFGLITAPGKGRGSR